MTKEMIEEAIRKYDLLIRPNVVFIHPAAAEALKAAYPEIENEVLIMETEAMEKGKAILVSRETLLGWTSGYPSLSPEKLYDE